MEHNKRHPHNQLGIGIFLLIVGVALLLENFNILNVGPVWRFWPVIIIAIGLGRLLDAQVTGEYQKAFWMLFIGGWLLISELHVFGLHYGNSWPILLIGIGIGMLWKSFYPEHMRIVKDHCNGN
jgi:predicted tellurium resistance membrane protein TerC